MKGQLLKWGMAVLTVVLFTRFLPLTAHAQTFTNGIESFENGLDGWTVSGGLWGVGTPAVGP